MANSNDGHERFKAMEPGVGEPGTFLGLTPQTRSELGQLELLHTQDPGKRVATRSETENGAQAAFMGSQPNGNQDIGGQICCSTVECWRGSSSSLLSGLTVCLFPLAPLRWEAGVDVVRVHLAR